MQSAVSSMLVVAGVSLFFVLMSAFSKRPARRDPTTGELILQLPKPLAWTMGIIAVGGPLTMGLLSFIIPFQSTAQMLVPIVLGMFFMLLGGLMCWWALKRRARIGPKGITSEYMFAKPRFLAWKDVAKITYANKQEFWLYDAAKNATMLHIWFSGLKEVVPMLREHLPDTVKMKYAERIDELALFTGAN